MKKLVLTSLVAAAAITSQAQTTVNDSVILGAGYANQTWYSLANDEQGSAPKNEWDLAFNVKATSAPVYINSANGVTLWNYPKDDTSGWAAIDTNGLSTWQTRVNSDTSWVEGAMGRYSDTSNAFDLDWGIYDMNNGHIVSGDSLYIIKLNNGAFKKLWMQKLASGVFYFKYANIDGTDEKSATITKADYTGKNFAYYSLQNNAAKNREPLSANWDLLFTQYTSEMQGMTIAVTGVLQNSGVRVAQANKIANTAAYNDYSALDFSSNINIIGSDWKTYDYQNSVYKIKDSVVYFVKPATGTDVWKMIYTGFSNVDGKIVFSKEKLVSTTILDAKGNSVTELALYPNPASGQAVTVAYNIVKSVGNAEIKVYDLKGAIVLKDQLKSQAGLHTYQIPASGFTPGMYVVTIATEQGSTQQRLIVR